MNTPNEKCFYCANPEHRGEPIVVVSAKRADEILNTRARMRDGGDLGPVSAGECEYIRRFWAELPGNFSYMSALSRISGGGTLEAPHASKRRKR